MSAKASLIQFDNVNVLLSWFRMGHRILKAEHLIDATEFHADGTLAVCSVVDCNHCIDSVVVHCVAFVVVVVSHALSILYISAYYNPKLKQFSNKTGIVISV